MTERLKFTVTYGKTVNTGNYESEKYVLSQEFYKDECDIGWAFHESREMVEVQIKEGKKQL